MFYCSETDVLLFFSQVNAQSDWLHGNALKMASTSLFREISEIDVLLFGRSVNGLCEKHWTPHS